MFRGLTQSPRKQYYLHQRKYSIDAEKVKYMYVCMYVYITMHIYSLFFDIIKVSSIPKEFILIDYKNNHRTYLF